MTGDRNSGNQGCFEKFIALLTALGGGVGVVVLLTYLTNFLGSPPKSPPTPYDLPNGSITQPEKPIENERKIQPQVESSASAFCSSQFPNRPRDYQDCLKASQNCDPSSVTYEVCILGEMGRRRIIDSPAPVPRPPIPSSSIALLDDVLDDLEFGNIVFNAPKKMQLGESERIELLLSPTKSIKELQTELENQIDIESANITIANRMEAHLSGRSFEIEPIISERQAISSRRTAQWLWDVIPTESGILTLRLSLTVYVELNNKEENYPVETFERDIKVEVSPLKRISIIFTSIWQFLSGMDWFWTVIIIPLAIFLWRKYYRNQDR